jgi:hypothetical protein
MIIQGTNLETGVEFQTVIEDLNQDFLASMNNFSLSDDEIRRSIDNLNVSADVKSLLFQFTKVTLKAGDFLLKIGRKIIEFVCLMYKEYKNATFGMIFGAIVGFFLPQFLFLVSFLGHFLPLLLLV